MTERLQYYMLEETALDIEFQVEYEDGERAVHVSSVSVWGSSLHMDRIPAGVMREIEDACLRVHDKKTVYAAA